ncbi:DUF3800 domain-containing protein [Methylosinus sp. H3A]|nr:DUF3800 domain-containing protein [Methylosinus sp. H3A]
MNDLENDDHRYLSLTGVAMKTDVARDDLTPKFDWVKKAVFNQDPDEPIIFHRRKIVQRKAQFGVLNDPIKLDLFNRAMLKIYKQCDYAVITAIIDKLEASRRDKWKEKHPYHYLMQILVEKFARFLVRKNSFGDIMPEGRKGKKDAALQVAYDDVRGKGNYYFPPEQIRYRIPASKLKIRYKSDNIAGLQLADLLAHPSHMHIRACNKHPVSIGKYADAVIGILAASKYDRSSQGRIAGYGVKYLP